MHFLEDYYERMVEEQKRHKWLFLFGIFLATGFFLFHALQLEVDTTLDQQLRPEDDFLTYRTFNAREFGETNSFFVVVKADPQTTEVNTVRDMRDPAVLAALGALEASFAEEGEVKQAVSIAGVFRQAFGRLPASVDESREWIELLGPDARSFFNKDYSATILIAGVNVPNKPGAADDLEKRFRARVADAPVPSGISATVTGNVVLLNKILNLMIGDNLFTMGVALVFVALSLAWLFRRFSLVFISTLPVFVAVIWLIGIMSLLDIRLSVANATVAAMVVGLGVDYAIHVTNSFDSAVQKHVKKPITRTMRTVGSALFLSFVTTFVGFAINLLGTTEATRVQGLTLAIGITCSFVVTMLLVPPLLKLKIDILREERGHHLWK